MRFTLMLLVTAMAVPTASAASDRPGAVEGQVVAVHQRVATANGGVFDELTIRTRQQQEMCLRLGPSGEGGPGYQAGDPVKAKVMAGGPRSGAYMVRTMRNQRTRTTERIRSSEGTLLRTRDRTRARDGSGDGTPDRMRSRDRVHEPGRSGGRGQGARGGGSRSGSRGGGGRG